MIQAVAEVPTLNAFKDAVRAGQRQFGFWSALPSSLLAEIVALSDFDWVLFDTEHAPADLMQLISQLHAIKGSRLHPVVRPAENDPVAIRRVLDIGFRSVLVPFVQTAAEAEQAVRATRYPPRGVRGVSAYQRNNLFGTLPGYFERIDDNICVLCQIETGEAADRLAEIASVPGVDALFVGPGDLAASLGHLGNVEHQDVQDCIARIGGSAVRLGKPAGIVAANPEAAKRYLDMGFSFMTIGADIPVFRRGVEDIAARIQSLRQALS